MKLALVLLVLCSGCSLLPATTGALYDLGDAVEADVATWKQTVEADIAAAEGTARAASSRADSLAVSVSNAQGRAANAERDIRLAREELRAFAHELGAIDPGAVADAGLGWLEVLGGGAGGAAGLAAVLAGIRQVLRREQRLATAAARDGGTGGPVEPPAPPTR